MNYKIKFFITAVVLGIFSSAMGQSIKMSLRESVDYAMQHHTEILNKLLAEKYAQAQVLETRAIGIPQVSANVQFLNNIEKQWFVFPDPSTGKNTPFQVGNKFSTTGTLAASWLAIDASYFLGVRAAEAYTDLTKQQTNLTQRDVAVTVTKAYYLVLITRENIALLEQNIKTLESVLFQTEGYYTNGFAEKIDVDRIKLTISNLSVQLDGLKDQSIITEKVLKLNMGMEAETAIELTDNLETLYKTSMEENSKSFDPKTRIEYQLLQSQLALNKLDKKRFEVSKLPNLALFANYQQNNFGDKLELGTWYSNSFWGFRVGVPIFSGFSTQAQIMKRNISIAQTTINMKSFEEVANVEVSAARVKFERSLKSIEIQKQNLALANEILKISSAKLKEGVGSNLEITNAQQEVRTSQTNYLNAVYDLLNAQIELKKAYGKF